MLALVDRWSAAFAADLLHAVALGRRPPRLSPLPPLVVVFAFRICPRSILIGWEARFFALHIGDGRVLRAPARAGSFERDM